MQAAATPELIPASTEGLERLFLEHHDLVFRAAYRVTGNPTDAEDVLQTVFLRLARHKNLSWLGESVKSYLHRSAINAAIDMLRSPRLSRGVPLEDVEMHLEDNSQRSPEDQLMSREIRGFLRKGLALLSPRDAEIFLLSTFEGYGNKEIAEMYGMPQASVGVILHRARTRLLERLRAFLGEKS